MDAGITKRGNKPMKLYVTGGTGMVGSNLIKVAVERHAARVFATVNQWKPSPPVQYQYEVVNMLDGERLAQTVRDFRPDAIVHCAILKGLRMLPQERQLAWRAYVETTRTLAEAAREVGAKMILVSTDWVFDGTQGPAGETAPPNPINYYGVLKVVGETLVAAACPNWAVARVAGVNGVHWARPTLPMRQNPGFGALMNAVAETLQAGQPFTVWDGAVNQQATPTLASEAAEMIVSIIQRDKTGVFHCCGGEGATRLQLACATAEGFGYDPGLIHSGPLDPTDPANLAGGAWGSVPKDTRLSAQHTAEQLGRPLLDIRQMVVELRRQIESKVL
jgi:dTDP-4-dehydrorhamnose reductase